MWLKKGRRYLLAVYCLLIAFLMSIAGCANKLTDEHLALSADGHGNEAGKIVIWELVLDDIAWATPMFEAAAAALHMEEEIEIVQQRLDPGVYLDQVYSSAAAKHPPDIVFGYGPLDIKKMSDVQLLYPLDSCLESYPAFQNIPDELWHEVTWQDHVWGFPVAVRHPETLFFNKRMLAAMGWSPEKIERLPDQIALGEFTLDDLLDTATLATELGIVESGFSLGGYASSFLPIHLFLNSEVEGGEVKHTVHRYAVEQLFRFREEIYKRNLVKEQFIQDSHNSWTTRLLFNDSVANGRFLFWKGDTHLWKLWSNEFASDLGGEDYMLENFGVAMLPAADPNVPLVTPGMGNYYAIYAPDQVEPHNLDQICAFFAKVVAPDINQIHSSLSGRQNVNVFEPEDLQFQSDPYTTRTAHLLEKTKFWEPRRIFPWDTTYRYVLRVESGELTPSEAADILILEMENIFGSQLIVK